jgi:acyl-coenzyme A thioesterase PaaI-like protein
MSDPSLLLAQWHKLSPKIGGKWFFSRLLGRIARYTGSISPQVLELAPGHAVVRMRDRAAVRNHLRSVHAIALMNLGEVATGLAVIACLGPQRRGIVTRLSMEYTKKARGTLTATCDFPPPAADFEGPFTALAKLHDESNELVATATAEWTLGEKS